MALPVYLTDAISKVPIIVEMNHTIRAPETKQGPGARPIF